MVSSSHIFFSSVVLCLMIFGQMPTKGVCADLENKAYYDEEAAARDWHTKRETPPSSHYDSKFEPVLNAFIQYYKLYLNNQLNSLQKSIIKTHLNHLGTQLLTILQTHPEYKLVFVQLVKKLEQNSAEQVKDKENLRNAFKWGRK
jgi:hypothetical protein